jgi:hydroxymethylglutaryl-CoA synthase
MVIGPDAPIVFEPGLRASYLTHAYDFYKPDLTSEYPVVDGHFSLKCYTEAVDACYKAYDTREKTLKAQANGVNGTNGAADESKSPLDRFDYILFHAPTCKLVQKSYARMLYNDYLANPSHPAFAEVAPELRDLDYEASLSDKTVEKTFMGLTKKRFADRVNPGLQVATQCGNMYTATVYGGLASLLSNITFDPKEPKRIGLFSYGSGLASSMFSAKIVGDVSNMVEKLDLQNRLNARTVLEPAAYDAMCKLREHAHLKKGFKPAGNVETIGSGVYYLTEVDDMFRRKYEIKA